MAEYRFELVDQSTFDETFIERGIAAYNQPFGQGESVELVTFARATDGTVIGGAYGEFAWDWLYVDLMWVNPEYRGQGYGRQMLTALEQEALKRGGEQAFLATTSFQALPFYYHTGYRLFGLLENRPPGYNYYYLKKTIRSTDQVYLPVSPDYDPEEFKIARQGLAEHNLAQGVPPDGKRLAVFMRDEEDKICGGLIAATYWNWLDIQVFWLEEALRGQGHGTQMLHLAQEEALLRGCTHAVVDVADFQALGFFRKQGYETFITLEGRPKGHETHFMRHDLTSLSPQSVTGASEEVAHAAVHAGTLLLGLDEGHLTETQLAQIRELAPDMRLLHTMDAAKIEAALDDIEVAVALWDRELLLKMPNLKWYQQWGAGADWLVRIPEMQDTKFVVTNVSGIHAIPISEHILAYMLAFARKLPTAFRAQQRKEWTVSASKLNPELKGSYPIFELAGQTAVIVGVGAIGARTAQLCDALDIRVLGVRRNPERSVPHVDAMYGPEQVLDVLPQGDFVIVTAPLTPETKGLFGAPTFKAMKSSAFLINIGRGGTINEAALVEALEQGEITGAGLDVFETEPLPQDSPLWEMENVIITRHYAGTTPYYDERAFDIFIDNLRRYKADQPLHHVVDKTLAY